MAPELPKTDTTLGSLSALTASGLRKTVTASGSFSTFIAFGLPKTRARQILLTMS